MLGVESVQFSLYQGRKRLSYGIFSLVLYSARGILRLESVQFFLQGREVKLQHFLSRTLFGTLYVRGREHTVSLHQGRKS